MLIRISMSNVYENANEIESSSKDPKMLDEDDDQHDPFEFLNDDNIPFSKLLSNLTIWWVQPFDNDDANLNMPILGNSIQVLDAPPLECTYSNGPKSTHAHAINGFHKSATP
jgi:hypothetical protein